MDSERDLERGLDRPSRRPADVGDRLGEGRALDASVRGRWEWVYGRDLSEVRVHDDAAGDSVAAGESAAAFAVGDDVGFRTGEYRPGTPAGDALIGHELAHVVQQQGATTAAGAARDTAAEADANRAMAGGLAGTAAAPRLRTGLRLQSCSWFAKKKQEPPSYLGARSLATLTRIEQIVGNEELAAGLIVFGMATASKEETIASGGPELGLMAEAAIGLSANMYDDVVQEIELLLISDDIAMNPEEKQFWERLHTRTLALKDRVLGGQRRASKRAARAKR